MTTKLGVVYLSYIPYGLQYLQSFLASYELHKSGVEHELIVLFNGYANKSETIPFVEYLESLKLSYISLTSPEKFDIGSYFYVSTHTGYDYLMFLNTYTQILHDDWLKHLYKNILNKEVGIISCTASWGAFGRDTGGALRFLRSLFRNNVAAKEPLNPTPSKKDFPNQSLFIKTLMYCIRKINFYPSMTPHLRTNAFIINRLLFLSLKYKHPKPEFVFRIIYNRSEFKFKTICFEHGNNSMTNQILKKGLNVFVIDKTGKLYSMPEWKDSHTFWYGNQENLMIQDNQTLNYTNGNDKEKAIRRFNAWNEK